MIKKLLTILATASLLLSTNGIARATFIVQDFSNSWSVDVWDYYGYVAAIDWQYQPYTASTKKLSSVELSIDIVVSGITPGDDFKYRSAFFTGWSPNAYQFYTDESFYDLSSSTLSINRDYLFTSEEDIKKWTNPQYGPEGNYYFESTTFSNSHTANVSTRLTFNEATSVPEPATMFLFGAGIAGLAAVGRRKRS